MNCTRAFDEANAIDRKRRHEERIKRERIEKAAPQLLDACRAILEYIEQEHDSLGDMLYFSKEVREQAKAAIAAAEKGE